MRNRFLSYLDNLIGSTIRLTRNYAFDCRVKKRRYVVKSWKVDEEDMELFIIHTHCGKDFYFSWHDNEWGFDRVKESN